MCHKSGTPPKKILCCLHIASLKKKKWIFKQSAAPTPATLAGAANGLRPLTARGLAGINMYIVWYICLLLIYSKKLTKNHTITCKNWVLYFVALKLTNCSQLDIVVVDSLPRLVSSYNPLYCSQSKLICHTRRGYKNKIDFCWWGKFWAAFPGGPLGIEKQILLKRWRRSMKSSSGQEFG